MLIWSGAGTVWLMLTPPLTARQMLKIEAGLTLAEAPDVICDQDSATVFIHLK